MKAKQSEPNTPKLPEDVEKRFDEVSSQAFFDIMGDMRYVVDVLDHEGTHKEELNKHQLHDELKEVYKQFLAKELANLKAQVRKEIEELKKPTEEHPEGGYTDFKTSTGSRDTSLQFAYNQAINDCLSIPSLKGEE